jgi:aldose 1-epimerase
VTKSSLLAIGLVCLVGYSAIHADETPQAKGKGSMASGITKESFGKLADGTPVDRYVLSNGKGMVAKIMTYGGIITELHVPDAKGKQADVVLGFDNLGAYVAGHPYFGCITGRVANRIARGKFTLDGKEYALATNNGPNALHGGVKGFDKVAWKADENKTPYGVRLKLTHTSPDGDEGYPGALRCAVTYTLTDQNALIIDYEAVTDKPTPINLTNHSYFNLGGHGAGLVHDHFLTLFAKEYTPVDATMIPTGEIVPVKGTPLDFTTATKIGARIAEMKGEPGGYDHNFVLNDGGKTLRLAAQVHEPKSGRVLEMLTTEPGVQLYTGNFLDGTNKGKQGSVYQKHAGFCLEAQHFPDAVNRPKFPSVILRPGETYRQTTVYRFSSK